MLALAEAAGRHGAGSICFLPLGTTRGLTAEDHEFIIEIGRRSGLPVIIQGLGARSKVDVPGTGWDDAVVILDKAQSAGAPFYSMLIARPFNRAVAFDDTNHHWRGAFGWHAMTRLPIEERRALLRDPKAREVLRFGIENSNKDPAKGTTLAPPQWPLVFVDESPSMAPEVHQGKSIQALAEERQIAPGDFALDLALADDFATKLRWRMDGPEWSDAVRIAQQDPRMIVGTSDGGAHLAKDGHRIPVEINSHVFQRELDLANANRDRQVYPVIGPGLEPGTSELTLKVKDRFPLHARGDREPAPLASNRAAVICDGALLAAAPDLAALVLRRTTARFRFRNPRRNPSPLGIRQVGGIGVPSHAA